jgi:hypothetical protein
MFGSGRLGKAGLLYVLVALAISASFLMPSPLTALLTYLFIILLTLLFAYHTGASFFWGGGFRLGALLAAALISTVFVLELGLGLLHPGRLISHAEVFLISAGIFEVLISLGEELSFRGFILPNLLESFGEWGVFLQAALFSLLHLPSMIQMKLQIANMVIMSASVFTAGVLLALCYLHSGLKMAIGFHFIWNFLQYHVYSLRYGFGVYETTAIAPLWTGGSAGPEAGVFGLVALMAGIVILLKGGSWELERGL